MKVGRKIVWHFKHSQLACSQYRFYMMESLLEHRHALGNICHWLRVACNSKCSTVGGHGEYALNTRTLWGTNQRNQFIYGLCIWCYPLYLGTDTPVRHKGRQRPRDSNSETHSPWCSEPFADIQTEPLYSVATLLDPRYKDRYFDRENKQSALDMLKATVDKLETCSSASESAPKSQS